MFWLYYPLLVSKWFTEYLTNASNYSRPAGSSSLGNSVFGLFSSAQILSNYSEKKFCSVFR